MQRLSLLGCLLSLSVFSSPLWAETYLQNVSTRAIVGEGDNQAIPGFIIKGEASRQVLIKAVGQGLQAFGVATALDPKITLIRMSDNSVVAENDNWQSDARNLDIPGAYQPTHPLDAALLVELSPGAYSVLVAPVSGAGNIGLVSVDALESASVPTESEPDTYLSNPINITGLATNSSITASVSSGVSLVINGVDTQASTGELKNGDTLLLKAASSNAGQGQALTLNFSTQVTTDPNSAEETCPEVFSPALNFSALKDANPGETYTSNTISIDNLAEGLTAAVSVDKGAILIINGINTYRTSSEVKNGDTIAVRAVAPGVGQQQDFTLKVGAYSGVWSVISKQALPATTHFSAISGNALARLSWDAVTQAKAYRLFKFNADEGYSYTDLDSATTDYESTGLKNGQVYEFFVVAIDEKGNEGLGSEVVSVTPQPIQTGQTPVAQPLNDTGQTESLKILSEIQGTGSVYDETCSAEEQDCAHGRDATHNDDSDGHAGFSFTKLDAGKCVLDNVTGLVWEVKQGGNQHVGDEGLHDADDTYTWYNTDATRNGGKEGLLNNAAAVCYGFQTDTPASYCNTEAYVARVNAEAWCGYSDWRLPNREELRSLVDNSKGVDHFAVNPTIDTDYFPNTVNNNYWSSSPLANPDSDDSDYAWHVSFWNGSVENISYGSNKNKFVRLVRGGQ